MVQICFQVYLRVIAQNATQRPGVKELWQIVSFFNQMRSLIKNFHKQDSALILFTCFFSVSIWNFNFNVWNLIISEPPCIFSISRCFPRIICFTQDLKAGKFLQLPLSLSNIFYTTQWIANLRQPIAYLYLNCCFYWIDVNVALEKVLIECHFR